MRAAKAAQAELEAEWRAQDEAQSLPQSPFRLLWTATGPQSGECGYRVGGMSLVRYYREGETDPLFTDTEDAPMVPAIGDGVFFPDGNFYRVTDRRARLGAGWQIYVKPAADPRILTAFAGAAAELEQEYAREDVEEQLAPEGPS